MSRTIKLQMDIFLWKSLENKCFNRYFSCLEFKFPQNMGMFAAGDKSFSKYKHSRVAD